MPVLPFAHLALYRFCNLPLFKVFLENAFLIIPFLHDPVSILHCFTILNVFYTPFYTVCPSVVSCTLLGRVVGVCPHQPCLLSHEVHALLCLYTSPHQLCVMLCTCVSTHGYMYMYLRTYVNTYVCTYVYSILPFDLLYCLNLSCAGV